MSELVSRPAITATIEELWDLFEHAPCGYLRCAPDGRVIVANTTFSSWVGRTVEGLHNERFRDLLTLPSRIFYETNFSPLLRLQGGFEEVALDLIGRNGEKVPVLVNAEEQRDEAGRCLSVRIVLMRAKDRRNYERDLQGREAAAVQSLSDERSTSELREQFIAVLGHDLRNPLSSIVGAATLLRRESLTAKGATVLDLMEASVGRMTGLIDDVMDFARSRLGSGIHLHRAVSPLEPVLRQVVSELEIHKHGLAIDSDFDLTMPVSFDKSRIGQLVSNLLGNAITHGDLSQPVRLRAADGGGCLEISVANGGKPIPPEALKKLFQPFFRGEVRPSQQGLGLGLHIASEIAKAHGGTLDVTSDATETRFTFSMPLGSGEPNVL